MYGVTRVNRKLTLQEKKCVQSALKGFTFYSD